MDESAIVLDTSLRVQKLFEQKTPFTVLLTRNDDTRPGNTPGESLKKRVEFAQENKGDIFVSIHANGFNEQVEGTETFYYRSATNPNSEESRVLAEKVQKRLVQALQSNDRGVKTENFYVVKYNTMPAILAELGFIDAKGEGEKLATEEWRQRAAEAIYQGILDYYEEMGNNVSSFR
ncbi:cell wall hydrolase/autolysin [Streptococcus pneumoniae]|nr:cell wall hydrolase/autolysin [Streptococcus pneumoniae]